MNNTNTEEIKAVLKNWPQIVKEYQTPNVKKAVIQIFNSFLPFLAIWVAMYFSLEVSYWLTLALGFLNAFFLVRIFIIQHDCGHQSFLKSRKVNNVIGQICSYFSMIPYKYWARSHNFHHAHNGQLETRDIGDLNTLTVEEFRQLDKWGRFKYRLYRSPLIMFCIGPVYYLTIHNRLPSKSEIMKGWTKERKALWLNNIGLASIYILMGFLIGWKNFLLVQAPIIVFFGIIAIWFFYVQHQHEENYKQWKENWEYLLSAIRGSSYYKLPKVMMWLTGNIGFHHIHHLSSLIPNYNLEKCNKENPILEKYVNILTFRESIKCAFYKLWDEQSQRMITFREFYQKERMLA
jgi:omega-6 fatty acid desaturase (delta-12 desaturase)